MECDACGSGLVVLGLWFGVGACGRARPGEPLAEWS